MSLFQELRRRNVFRVGIAYAVAGWLVLQLTDVLSELLDLPASVGPVVVAVVALGFPLALALAWAFELTPEGVKRESDVDRQASITHRTGRTLDRVIIVLLVVVAAYFIWEARFAPGDADSPAGPETASIDESSTGAPPASAAGPATPEPENRIDPHSIAVLPFDNRSRLEDDAFFVEGIHDDLLTNLARISGLKVISRTSVARYAETTTPIPEIAAELGVATVMEGAVQRSGDMVRINVQLIDARTDEHLWAQIFDRTLTADNLFAIQTEISEQIAGALETELTADESARLVDRPTDNLEAYTAYLRGRQLMVNRRSDELTQALEEFRRATALDPDFALAWVGIADAATHATSYGTLDFTEANRIRQEAIDRALGLDPELGEAHLAKASLMGAQGRDPTAEFERAIELSPGNATTYHWYANHLGDTPSGIPQAVDMLHQALEIDPLSSIIRRALVSSLTTQGRYAEAQRELDRLLELDPDFVLALTAQAELYSRQGRFDLQVDWLQRAAAMDPDNIAIFYGMIWAFLNLEDPAAIERLRRHLLTRVSEDHLAIAWTDSLLTMGYGNPDAALEHIAWIYQRMGQLPYVKAIEGYLYNHKGDAERARAAFEVFDPRLFDPERWQDGIVDHPRDACLAAWMLINTGEEAKGRALVDDAVRYLEEELPRYVDHADNWGNEECYVVQGDVEAALAVVETRFEHRHLKGWHFYEKQPHYAPLLREPRFQELDRQRRALMAEQRAAIEGLDFGEAGP